MYDVMIWISMNVNSYSSYLPESIVVRVCLNYCKTKKFRFRKQSATISYEFLVSAFYVFIILIKPNRGHLTRCEIHALLKQNKKSSHIRLQDINIPQQRPNATSTCSSMDDDF